TQQYSGIRIDSTILGGEVWSGDWLVKRIGTADSTSRLPGLVPLGGTNCNRPHRSPVPSPASGVLGRGEWNRLAHGALARAPSQVLTRARLERLQPAASWWPVSGQGL